MKIVRNLEDFFEKYIEGFFNRKFSTGLQPVEIAKQLTKEMEKQKSVGVTQIYVPNSYQVYMNAEEFEHLSPYSEAVCEEVAHYLTEEASRKAYTIVGKPCVEMSLDASIGQEKFYVTSCFTKPIPTKQEEQGSEAPITSDTRVFDKVVMGPVDNTTDLVGVLTVVDGQDVGLKIDVRMGRINIGRRQSNEMPLADMNTSRLHAYVLYEDNGHVLHDGKSLNGTYVNGHRIVRKPLQQGDRITVGNTIILYGVK